MAHFDPSASLQTPRGSLAYQLSNMWNIVPQGHEKHLKQAFYNTVANVFIILAGAAAVGVYFILAPFLRPLYWALLCGTFLYPFKWALTNALRNWLTGLQSSRTPFGAGLVILPLQIGDGVAQVMMKTILEYRNVFIGLLFGIPITYCLYHFAPVYSIFQLSIKVVLSLYRFVDYFDSYWVLALVIGYAGCAVFFWTPESKWLSYLAAPVWISLFLYLANMTGPLRAPLFLLIVVVITVGVVKELFATEDQTTENTEDSEEADDSKTNVSDGGQTASVEQGPSVTAPATTESSSVSSISLSRQTVSATEANAQLRAKEADVQLRPNKLTSDLSPLGNLGPSKSSPAVLAKSQQDLSTQPANHNAALVFKQLKESQVNSFFHLLILAHLIVRVWMHVWLVLLIFLFPLVHYCGHAFLHQFYEGGVFYERFQSARASFLAWWEARVAIIFPKCLRGFWAFLMKSDQQMISLLEKGLDQATSVLFILLLLVGTVLFSLLAAVQIHRETVYMASATQKMLNNTMNSEFSGWMPNAEEIKTTMDHFLKNSHQQGRNFIGSKVTDFLPKDISQEERDNLVNQFLEMWDKLHDTMSAQFAEQSSASPEKTDDASSSYLPSNLFASLNQFSGMFRMSSAIEFVKQNLGMFMSVLESVFTVMKSNMTLILTVITFIISAILGGGTAILNFVISSLIFLTTLVYLLSSSKDVYKPVELFSSFSIPGATGNTFGQAVEQAISGVFKASIKMMAFYGLYTWLIHLVFGMEIVFIPSALAAVFAAVPLVGPYWAAIPAVIELWLVQGRGISALALFIAHIVPTSVVDTRIYSEIEGGHPYVTGLAIAGGTMCLGLEGALIGPIILCCLIVVFKMYGSLIDSESPSGSQTSEGKHTGISPLLKRHQSLI